LKENQNIETKVESEFNKMIELSIEKNGTTDEHG